MVPYLTIYYYYIYANVYKIVCVFLKETEVNNIYNSVESVTTCISANLGVGITQPNPPLLIRARYIHYSVQKRNDKECT